MRLKDARADVHRRSRSHPDSALSRHCPRDLGPDLILLDVQLPDIDGFDVASRLMDGEDGPMIVLTSSRDGADFGPLIERSGARGFIPKAELSGERLRALTG